MNINELNQILETYYSFDDIVGEKFNISENDKFELIIISPTWKPHFVFNDEYSIENLKQGTVASYKLMYKGKKTLYIKIGKGAPYIYDNLLLLRNYDTNFVFLGSAGSLCNEIEVGDIVVPKYSISGDGASLYFNEKLNENTLFKKIMHSNVLVEKVNDISKKLNILIKDGDAFSTDTLIGEYYHLKEIIAMGAKCIEQETAAFANCMNIMEKEGIPLLSISDCSIKGQNYYEPLKNKEKYLNARQKKLQKIINELY